MFFDVFIISPLCWFADATLTVEPNWSTLFTGESVTVFCDMKQGADTDWYYSLFRDGQEYYSYRTDKSFILQHLTNGFNAQYHCMGSYKPSGSYTKISNTVFLTVSGKHFHKFINVIYEPCWHDRPVWQRDIIWWCEHISTSCNDSVHDLLSISYVLLTIVQYVK